ncbi:hypothetical protein D9619_012494 [Psilocybe cf. subviscida]|uniref:Uncharacterized protein n=1 Tax=Psilocybe cf. subviscida TaxID=2480587 RepID=A0A8H5ERD4_9AGAR|nr:hypothetical protein D9619_012494 [Psilocybe cf. subviscida]
MSSGIQTEVHITSLLASLSSLCSAFITLLATSLIALKIVLVTRNSRIRHSYAKTIEIIVESAALVSFITLVMGILELISYVHPYDLGTTSGLLVYRALVIVGRIQNPVIGIGPTLIAFRVAAQPANTDIGATSGTMSLSHFTLPTFAHSSTHTNQHIVHTRMRSGSPYEVEPVERT